MSLFSLIRLNGWVGAYLMSKKLLMNYASNNGLLPVMDGLICWLDGRWYVSGEDTWRDMSGHNNNATLSNTTGINKNNALYFKGGGNIENPTLNLANYTVEVHVKDLKTGYWNGLYGNTGGTTGNSVYINSKDISGYPYNNIHTMGLLSPYNRVVLSIVYETNSLSLYFNGKFIKKVSYYVHPSTAEYFLICARKLNSPSNISNAFTDDRLNEWYSFKIYNRALSEKEIHQNYLYEQSVHGGGEL